MALGTLHDVLVDNLKDLLNAEKQLVKALPKMAKAASDEQLKAAFEEHVEVTREQAQRLEKVFRSIGETAKGKKCKGMEGLIEEGEEVLENRKDSEKAALDAALIIGAQKVEHYEISAYGSARTLAEELGYTQAAELLQETLDEESEANEKLTNIAMEINQQAAALDSEEEEQEEDENGEFAGATGGRGPSRGRSRNGSRRPRYS